MFLSFNPNIWFLEILVTIIPKGYEKIYLRLFTEAVFVIKKIWGEKQMFINIKGFK